MAEAEAVQGSPENYKGMYGSLKFPPRKHHEYPKLLYRDDGKLLGTANNAMEEKELYASIGVEKADIDPLGAAQDELAVLRTKLAQYEGTDTTKQVAAKTSGVKTATVEMLPADAPAKPANPLLKPAVQPAGEPGAKGTAPVVDKQISPGV